MPFTKNTASTNLQHSEICAQYFTNPIPAYLDIDREKTARDSGVKRGSRVRTSTIVMIAFAVLFGLLAVFVAQSWLNSATEQRMRRLDAHHKPLQTSTL